MLRTGMRSILAFVVFMAAAPAHSADVVQVFRCEQEDEATEDAILATAQEWLTLARKSKGGERLEVHVYFPTAVNPIGETDFLVVLTAPSFEQWGVFWDNFQGSPVAELDERMDEVMICPSSALWEKNTVEVKPQ